MRRATKVLSNETLTHSEEETFKFGYHLAQSLPGPSNLLLTGELGMGKTVLAKGIICGLGVPDRDDVVSPSFTLIQEYRVNDRVIAHVDLYRLNSPREIDTLGLEELFTDERLYVIVEWADKLPPREMPRCVSVRIEDAGENDRSIQVEGL